MDKQEEQEHYGSPEMEYLQYLMENPMDKQLTTLPDDGEDNGQPQKMIYLKTVLEIVNQAFKDL